MRALVLVMSIISLISCQEKISEPIEIDSTVKNFGLYDHLDAFHRLYYYDNAEAIVLYVQGNSCPIVRKSIKRFEEVREEYEEKGFKFLMINANPQDTRDLVSTEAENFGIKTPILIDENQLAADILDLDITAEVFVISTADWSVLYRGPIDDQLGYGSDKGEAKNHYLTDVLNTLLAGEPVDHIYRKAKGCAIARIKSREAYDNLVYEDIAPILKANCYKCHQEGGIAPWPMNGYPMVAGWSAMMREMLNTRRMPPWHADPHYGLFKNDMSLSQEDIRKIVAWVNGGSKKGQGEDILAALIPNAQDWTIGEPDYIVSLDIEEIPATGIIDYRYQTVEVDIKEDKYVKAIEVKPGNSTVLHHVLASIDYPKGYNAPVDRSISRWFDGLLVGWAPGGETEVFPEGTGRLLPAGSKVVFQMHYTTSGKVESDKTSIGLYFAEQVPEKEYVIVGPVNYKFEIPPGVRNFPVNAKYEITRPTKIHAVLPHMHYRGQSMKYVAHYPDGTSEVLFSAADYNFNWQRFYYLNEPKVLPTGSYLTVEALFDNTAQNEFNPDPTATIYFGEQTFDEMMIGYMSITFEDELGSLSTL